MKTSLLTLLVLFAAINIHAVNLPITFESGTPAITNFDGGVLSVIDNPDATGLNTTAKVAKMVKGAGQPWAGAYITLDNPIDFSSSKTFKMKVWAPKIGTKVLLKVENASDGGINFEKEVTTLKANEWEEVTFDYSTIDDSKEYKKVVIIFDLGTMGDGSANFTYYLDDIMLEGMSTETKVEIPVDFESSSLNYSFTDFDGGAVTIIDNPDKTGINTSDKVGKMVKGAGQPWAGSYLTLDKSVDFSTSKTFKMKVWAPKIGTKVLLKVENLTDGGINFEKEVLSEKSGQWEELVFDYSAVDATKDYHKIVLIFDNGTVGDGSANFTYYFDDIKVENVKVPLVLPIGFESASINYAFTNFDGGNVSVIDNPDANGLNTSVKVAKMIKGAGQPWAGAYLTLDNVIDFSMGKIFKMKVWAPKIGTKVLLKIENLSDGGINFEKEVLTKKAGEWEELIFDYNTVDATKDYQKIVLIFDNGTVGDGSANFTYYFDDIILEGTTPMLKISEASNTKIISGSNYLEIFTDAVVPVTVYDISGKKLIATVCEYHTNISLKKGIYIVQVGNYISRRLVK